MIDDRNNQLFSKTGEQTHAQKNTAPRSRNNLGVRKIHQSRQKSLLPLRHRRQGQLPEAKTELRRPILHGRHQMSVFYRTAKADHIIRLMAEMTLEEAAKILGINPTSPSCVVRRKFRELSKKCHPDVNKSNEAQTEFVKLNQAYQTIENVAEILRATIDLEAEAINFAVRCSGGKRKRSKIMEREIDTILNEVDSSGKKDN